MFCWSLVTDSFTDIHQGCFLSTVRQISYIHAVCKKYDCPSISEYHNFSSSPKTINYQIIFHIGPSFIQRHFMGFHLGHGGHLILIHDDIIKGKHFPCYRPFVKGIRWSPAVSHPKGQWRGALGFSFICAIKKPVMWEPIMLIMMSL